MSCIGYTYWFGRLTNLFTVGMPLGFGGRIHLRVPSIVFGGLFVVVLAIQFSRSFLKTAMSIRHGTVI